jgi:hypothetical protein
MDSNTVSRKLMAMSLCLLLAACGAPRYAATGPSGPWELMKYVLVIEQRPDGQVAHSWRLARDFDPPRAPYQVGASGFGGHPVCVSADFSHCHVKQATRIDICTASPFPIPIEGEEFQRCPRSG